MAPWIGTSELQAAFEKIAVRADMASKAIVSESAALVIAKAQRNFEGVRTRRKSGTGKSWTVTPARHVGGDKPNIITGYLRRSIRMTPIVRFGRGDYVTKVGPDAIYGRSVELGYKGSKGYPFFVPAVEEAMPEFEAIRLRIFRTHLS